MELPSTLDDGLVMRLATPRDAEALAAFNTEMHTSGDPGDFIGPWTRDLLARPHPLIAPSDFLVVVDGERIVSSTALFSQTWSYAGVPFPAGRPELVATHPDYRRRGLIARQFDVLHAWSAARGELVLGITGISWYYRQFGYEMCVDLGGGPRATLHAVREAAAKEPAPYRVRPASEADIPFLMKTEEAGRRRSLVACVRDEAMWRYELTGRSVDAAPRLVLAVVEAATPPHEPVGFIGHVDEPWLEGELNVHQLEVVPGVPWSAVLPSVWRYLAGAADDTAKASGRPVAMVAVEGPGHPVARLAAVTFETVHPAYAWYIRVPDVARFLHHIGSVLEARLAGSPLAGYGGDVRLNFFTHGVVLRFVAGRLAGVDPWEQPDSEAAHASFPDRTFLQLLFGHRSFAELVGWYADCTSWKDEGRALMDVLFEKRPSVVWAIG